MAGGRFGAVPPDLARRILKECGLDPDASAPPPAAGVQTFAPAERRPPMVAPGFTPPATWTVPIVLPSLANDREWRTRNRVAKAHRETVNRYLAMQMAALVPFAHGYHHGGKTILCVLTRLGGRALDRTVNLPASLKYVEDAVCLKLGIDDGCPRWSCRCEQEPGGPAGVRIELGIAEGHE